MRSGFFILAAIFVMSMVLVFVLKMQSGLQILSNSQKIFCLRGKFSMTASMTISH